MLLGTSRLIIEQFASNDVPDWAEIENDADVRRFVDRKVLSLKEAGEYVDLIFDSITHMAMEDIQFDLKKTKPLLVYVALLLSTN